MPDLRLSIESAEPVAFAAAPLLAFRLRVQNQVPGESIHTIALKAQIQIDASKRRYTDEEKERLADLFGDPDRWSRTLRPMLWTHANLVIPAFEAEVTTDLQAACTFDFNVAATKYFHGVSEGEIPLTFLFSGTVFYATENSGLQVAPIPWDKEARFRLSAGVWRAMMDEYYPNTAWLALRRDVFERVYDFRVRHGIPTWEEAFKRLLETGAEETLLQ